MEPRAFCTLAFIIIAAIRANEGKVWKFPLSIPFFAMDASMQG